MPHPALSGKRIAVVEDETPLGAVLKIMLGEIGCVHAGTARTLDEAVALADNVDADAVLLDFRLKGQESAPAAQRFCARGIKVILATGADAGAEHATGACEVVKKPFGLTNLEEALLRAFSGANANSDAIQELALGTSFPAAIADFSRDAGT